MNEWIDLMKNKLLITINISKQKANLINYKEQSLIGGHETAE